MADKKEMELTEEEVREDILEHEDDYIAGLLEAAENVDAEIKTIEIIRNKKKYFAFRIHSLTEEELADIRKVSRYGAGRPLRQNDFPAWPIPGTLVQKWRRS